MRKWGFFLILSLIFIACSPKTIPVVDIDVSTRGGKAPLSVVGYVFFNVNYKCADIQWIYWYQGFEADKNESKEKVCNAKAATHQFGFLIPGNVKILITVKVGNKRYLRVFNIIVGESSSF